MLLQHTPKEITERKAVTINPTKTCQPIGAMYAALGIHACLPHSHGSQGCCAYHRSMMTRHYKDPVMASTSSFTEGASVFGGQANLVQAIGNIFTLYEPEVIAVHTTCLSETIGDDIPQIVSKAQDDGKIPEGKYVIHCNTPSYVGTHVTGFSNMVKGMVNYFSESTGEKNGTINILPGWVEPSDMREIKRLLKMMGTKFIMFPDTSGVLDSPMSGKYKMYPEGGARVSDIRKSGDSKATLAFGTYCSKDAAEALDAKCKVPCQILDIPIGISATDRFIQAVKDTCGVDVPKELEDERGRVVDMVCDMQQYLCGKRVALYGDPDQVMSLTELLVDVGAKPVYIFTGTKSKKIERRLRSIIGEHCPEAVIEPGGDLFKLHQLIKNGPVDLLIGNTHGKYIARDEDVPFVRFGFPLIDRVGHSYFPTVGYMGTMRLLEKMLNAILDRKDRDAPEESFELVL